MIDINTIVPLLTNVFSSYSPDMLAILILPPLTDIINKDIPETEEWKKFVLSLAACFLVAAVVNWHLIMIGSPAQALTSFGLLFTASQALFKLYFKDSILRSKLQGALTSTTPEPLG